MICTECKHRWPQYKNSQIRCKAGELIYFISDTEHKPFNGKCSLLGKELKNKRERKQ